MFGQNSTYLISFRLEGNNRDARYANLRELLEKKIEGDCWDSTTSFYVKRTEISEKELISRIKQVVTPNDQVLVVDYFNGKSWKIGNIEKNDIMLNDLIHFIPV